MRILTALVILLLSGCGPKDTGGACSTDADCESGAQCHVGAQAGYCAASCETEGSADGCPANTLCKAIQGGPRRCLLTCETQEECPTGSNCTGLSSGSAKVCEPQP